MMKPDELKLRVANKADSLIDTYYGGNNIVEKLMNSTMKVVLHQNIDKIDALMNLFTDASTGEIDANMVIQTYAKQFENGVEFDIRDYVDDGFLKGILPYRKLIIKKDDIMSILM